LGNKETHREGDLIKETHTTKDVQKIIDSFKSVNPTHYQLFKNTNQGAAVQRMLNQFGRSHLEALIAILPQTNSDR
jgi:hypothetical protein